MTAARNYLAEPNPVRAQLVFVETESCLRAPALVAWCRVFGIYPANPTDRAAMARALWLAKLHFPNPYAVGRVDG